MTAPSRRIHITGAAGSGKTTLAGRLSTVTGLPVHHLDDLARADGGNGPPRGAAERESLVEAILGSDGWISEGIQLGWTEPLLEGADVIVWLDTVSPARARGRIVRRFVVDALREMRLRQGRERFTRVGDYVRHLGSLVGAMRAAGAYELSDSDAPVADGASAGGGGVAQGTRDERRASTEAALAPHRHKVVRCLDETDIDALVHVTASGTGRRPRLEVRP